MVFKILITFICFNITQAKASRWSKKAFKRRACWLYIYIYVLQSVSTKKKKKKRNNDEEICVSCSSFVQNFGLKTHTYVEALKYVYIYIYIYETRQCSCTLIHVQSWPKWWLISPYRCIICVCLKRVESFPRIIFIMNEREGQNTKERNRNEKDMSEENDLCQ